MFFVVVGRGGGGDGGGGDVVVDVTFGGGGAVADEIGLQEPLSAFWLWPCYVVHEVVHDEKHFVSY